MTSAGDYYTRFQWKQYHRTKDTTTGQEIESWDNSMILWGYISADKKLKQTDEFGITKNQSQVEIRIRNYIDIDPKDRLIDLYFGGTYRVDGRHWGENEVIVEADEMRNEDGSD